MKDFIGTIFGGLIIGIGFVGLLVLISVVLGFPVMWCWNYIIPSLFGLPELRLDGAIVLNILCGLLFKNFSTSK
jgi:hypothetical protein